LPLASAALRPMIGLTKPSATGFGRLKTASSRGALVVQAEITIRSFVHNDAPAVRELFILVNRLLSPQDMKEAFELYIARSLRDEIDRIPAYYHEHQGGFWVAVRDGQVAGMFGLENAGSDVMELRRMYVHPSSRRSGIASAMLHFAEDKCRGFGKHKLELSTSELQPEAIGLYGSADYKLVREIVATDLSNKTVGGGIRRYHFEKNL
jgi:GNAT superfamily N-acetyltransferase